MSSVLSLARARVEDSLTTSQVRHVQLINDQQTVSHESFLNLAPTREALLLETLTALVLSLPLCPPLHSGSSLRFFFLPADVKLSAVFFFSFSRFFLKKKRLLGVILWLR